MPYLLEEILISLVLGFFVRNISMMLHYCLTYGQLLGHVKMFIAFKIDAIYTREKFLEITSQSSGEQISIELYDVLCNYKYLEVTPTARIYSWVLSLLDCPFCIGFWISFLFGLAACFSFGTAWYIVLIPILSFFIIEKC